jgi:predicted transcriptional regulator
MESKKMPDLKESLLDILKSSNEPLSVGDILEILNYDEKISSVQQALRTLEEEHKIVSFTEQKRKVGRPRKLYVLVEKEKAVRSITRADYERENLLRDLVNDSAGRYSIMPLERVQAIFKSAAERLLQEDPRRLLLRFAKWLKNQHKLEIKLYKKFMNAGSRQEMEKHLRNIERLEKITHQVFAQMLGVPEQLTQKDGTLSPGPFFLKLNKRNLEDDSALNPTELEKYVSYSVHGPSFIEKFAIDSVKLPIRLGGSDSSIQPISLSGLLPWMVEHCELNIITAVGVKYDIFQGASDIDRYPDPSELANYERTRAIEEGLLIPPAGTMGYEVEMENRVKEAAMDLRQYVKDFELMFRHEPAVHIHFRDGRIFPYEHRLSDALQVSFHGDMVRTSLKAFRNIVYMVGAENGEMLYCGFVKRPGTRFMAPLVLWYVGFGSGEDIEKSIDSEMTLEDFLRTPYSDNFVVNQLFAAVKGSLRDDEVCLTFRLLRRFQSLEETPVQSHPPNVDREVWYGRLDRFNKQYFGKSSEESGARLIADLCSRAAVVEFYCSLKIDPKFEPHAQIPRLEFLFPYPDFEEALFLPQDSNTRQIKYIRRLLGVLFNPGVLIDYPDSLFYFEQHSPDFFLAPKPVCEAHDSAKLIAKEYKKDFVELLIREAKAYWASRTRPCAP